MIYNIFFDVATRW